MSEKFRKEKMSICVSRNILKSWKHGWDWEQVAEGVNVNSQYLVDVYTNKGLFLANAFHHKLIHGQGK